MTVRGGAVAIIAFILLRTVLQRVERRASSTRRRTAWRRGTRCRSSSRCRRTTSTKCPQRARREGGDVHELVRREARGVSRRLLREHGDGRQRARRLHRDQGRPGESLARWKADKMGALVGDNLASKYHWKVGDKVVLQGTIFPGDWKFTVDGIYTVPQQSSVPRTNFWFHWAYMNDGVARRGRRTRSAGSSSRINDPSQSAAISDRIDKLFDDSDMQTDDDERAGDEQLVPRRVQRRPRRARHRVDHHPPHHDADPRATRSRWGCASERPSTACCARSAFSRGTSARSSSAKR